MSDQFGAYVYMVEPLITWFHVVIIGIATGAVSLFITKSALLISFHKWLEKKSPFLEELLSCPWCLSHWVGMFFLLVYQPYPLDGWHPGWMYAIGLGFFLFLVDWFVTLMVVVFVAVLVAGAMFRALKPMME